MIKQGIIFLTILLMCSTAWGYGIVNNSGSTPADSLSIGFYLLDSGGCSILPLASGDSVFLYTFYPSGALAFEDSAAYNGTKITAKTRHGKTVYTWKDAVANLDGTAVQGTYTYILVAKDKTSAALDNPFGGEFQLLTETDFNTTMEYIKDALDEVVNIDAWNPITDNESLIVDQSTLEDMTVATVTDVTNGVTLANDAITAAKIATNAITADELAASAIGASEIATGAIDADAIAASAIGTDEIATNAIGASEIATNAIGVLEIAAAVFEEIWRNIDTTNIDSSLLGEWFSTGISASISDANMGAIADSVHDKDTADAFATAGGFGKFVKDSTQGSGAVPDSTLGDVSALANRGVAIVAADTLSTGDTVAVMPNEWVAADSTAYQGAAAGLDSEDVYQAAAQAAEDIATNFVRNGNFEIDSTNGTTGPAYWTLRATDSARIVPSTVNGRRKLHFTSNQSSDTLGIYQNLGYLRPGQYLLSGFIKTQATATMYGWIVVIAGSSQNYKDFVDSIRVSEGSSYESEFYKIVTIDTYSSYTIGLLYTADASSYYAEFDKVQFKYIAPLASSGDNLITYYAVDTAGTDTALANIEILVLYLTGQQKVKVTTNSSGCATFHANDYDTLLVVAKGFPDHLFFGGDSSGYDTLYVAASNMTDTSEADDWEIGTPAGADVCRCYAWAFDYEGNAVEGATLTATFKGDKGMRDTCNSTNIVDYIATGKSDATGKAYVDIIKSKCIAPQKNTIFTLEYNNKIYKTTELVPDSTNHQIGF